MSHKSFLLGSGVMVLLLMITPAYLVFQSEVMGAFVIGAINALVWLSMFSLARYLTEPSANAASQLSANLFKEEIRARSPKTSHELPEQSSRSFAA